MTTTLLTPQHTEAEHAVWAALFHDQSARLNGRAAALFYTGLPQLNLDPQRLPDPAAVSARLQTLTGWTLGDAQNDYLGATEWFEHLAARRFPVTNYIRPMEDLAFTPLPDLFHEYFGHLAFFADQRFADIAQAFGPLYLSANERQQLEIARIWWYTTEFGLVREGGALKALGAGLLSSPEELERAFAPDTPRQPFDVRTVAATPSAVYSTHPCYFVLDSVEQIADILRGYAAEEGLPVPAL